MEAILLRLLIFAAATPAALALLDPPSPSPTLPTSPTTRATALFVLGDSSVNRGDNSIFNLLLPHNQFSSQLIAGSRLLPDFIAQKMGLPPPPPYYRSNWTAEALSSGVNFGSNPATILSASAFARSPVGAAASKLLALQTLNQQVRQVCETIQLLHLTIGPSAARQIASSLLFISFGRDDYIDIFSGDIAEHPMYGRRALGRLLVSQIILAIKDLYNAGARKIAVMGVGPLGCSPRMRWKAAHALQGQQCVEEINEMVSGYNTRLAAAVRELDQMLPGALVVFCDAYKGMMEIISNPEIYGFNNTRDACCGAGYVGGVVVCMACPDPSVHLWWDSYGTTEAADALLANWSWSPLPSHLQICTPLNLQQLASSSSPY